MINAAQTLLKRQYPHISGLQNTLLGEKLQFTPVSSYPAIQIFFTGITILGNSVLSYRNVKIMVVDF